jgi:hypothetical protein
LELPKLYKTIMLALWQPWNGWRADGSQRVGCERQHAIADLFYSIWQLGEGIVLLNVLVQLLHHDSYSNGVVQMAGVVRLLSNPSPPVSEQLKTDRWHKDWIETVPSSQLE